MIQPVIRSEFSAVELVDYFRSRSRFVGIACASALLVTGMASLVATKRYTATASLVIEPPAGMDPRSATALSPVYLESLKTYEKLVSSDSLFQQASEHLGILKRFPTRSIESLKRSVLRVSKPVNTRVIEIVVTLDNPRDAQQLASYIARQASALNRSIDAGSAADAAKDAETSFRQAEERLNARRKASDGFVSDGSGADAELSNLSELKYSVDRERGEAQAQVASPATSDYDPASNRARVAELDRQSNDLAKKIEATAGRLEQLRHRRDSLDAELKAARVEFEAARVKLEDLRASAGFRGERLEVFDPGIVPQRPSFPDIPLNLFVALLVSLGASCGYLAICFGLARARQLDKQVRGHW